MQEKISQDIPPHFGPKFVLGETDMYYDLNELKNYPEIMNKEQFTKLCHIAKRTALYLLESGLVPCECTGKKTRCYKIKKSDIVAFVNDKTVNPNKYIPPEHWYTYGNGEKSITVRVYPDSSISKEKMKGYYKNCLAKYPDLMTTQDVVRFTGYVRETVANWVNNGHLQVLTKTYTFHIPKVYLIDFLCSDYYNNLIRKTPKHMNAIWQMSR